MFVELSVCLPTKRRHQMEAFSAFPLCGEFTGHRRLVIWDAIALIMTSLSAKYAFRRSEGDIYQYHCKTHSSARYGVPFRLFVVTCILFFSEDNCTEKRIHQPDLPLCTSIYRRSYLVNRHAFMAFESLKWLSWIQRVCKFYNQLTNI